MSRRAGITGVGVLSAFGEGREALWQGLAKGACPRSRCTFGGDDRLPPLGEVEGAFLGEPDVGRRLGRKGLRHLGRETKALLYAASLAVEEAGLDPARWDRSRVGVAVGTLTAGLEAYMDLVIEGEVFGVERVNPALGPQSGFNAPASELCLRFGAEAANLTVVSGRASGLDALASAADLVEGDRGDVILAAGVDTVSFASVLGLRRSAGAPPPAEAAVVVVVENVERARRRGATVLAQVGARASAFAGGGVPDLETALERALVEALGPGSPVPERVVSSGEAAEEVVLARRLPKAQRELTLLDRMGDAGGALGALQAAMAVEVLRQETGPSTSGSRALITCLDPRGFASAMLLERLSDKRGEATR